MEFKLSPLSLKTLGPSQGHENRTAPVVRSELLGRRR